MKQQRQYHVNGRLIHYRSGQGIANLRVEAWDKDLLQNDLLGQAVTDEHGFFEMTFDESYFQETFLEGDPDLFFKVYRGSDPVESTQSSVEWPTGQSTANVLIKVTKELPDSSHWHTLEINSYAELAHYEEEILKRIGELHNGGNLFMIHPFLLLADIGVSLSEETRTQILQLQPRWQALSAVPYRALKATKEPQAIRIRIRQLFPWSEK